MKKLDVLVLMVACVFLLASCSKEADDRSHLQNLMNTFWKQ